MAKNKIDLSKLSERELIYIQWLAERDGVTFQQELQVLSMINAGAQEDKGYGKSSRK